MTARAGIARKYLPNFDRSDAVSRKIVTFDETALTIGGALEPRFYLTLFFFAYKLSFSKTYCVIITVHLCVVRTIYEWKTVTGKISRLFQHPSKRGSFNNFVTNDSRTKLYAIDASGVLFEWKYASQTASPPSSSLKRRTTSRLGSEKSRKLIAKPLRTVDLGLMTLKPVMS